MASAEEGRQELLLKMYDQMFNDIDRHILVVWQSIGVLIGAFAVFALVESNIIPLDVATSLIVLISAWLVAHLYDASYWYNRNLVIIANIERQFLRIEDLREIHYYFGRHRTKGAMITHLRIQYLFGLGIATVVLYYHYTQRIAPLLARGEAPWWNPESLPYMVALASMILIYFLRQRRAKSYEEFLTNSPGKKVDDTGIKYGVGHPTNRPRS